LAGVPLVMVNAVGMVDRIIETSFQ